MDTPPAPSRLFLIVPPLPRETAADALRAVLETGPVGCVLLTAEAVSACGDDLAKELIALTQKRGIAVLLENNLDECKRLGADGVHLTRGEAGREAIARAKAELGPDAPVGAACGLSRHEAMVNAEAGADYVAFSAGPDDETGTLADMLAWWDELFEVPCVAWHHGGLDEVSQLSRAGAGFIAVNDAVWRTDDAPASAMKSLFRAAAV